MNELGLNRQLIVWYWYVMISKYIFKISSHEIPKISHKFLAAAIRKR